MFSLNRLGRVSAVVAALCACGLGCDGGDPLEDRVYEAGVTPADSGAGSEPGTAGSSNAGAGGNDATGDLACIPAVASDPLRARSAAMARHAPSTANSVFTDNLYVLFSSYCQGCHIEQAQGGFQVSRATFARVVSDEAVKRLTSDDPSFLMPAGSLPFSQRPPNDGTRELARLLQAWIDDGRPDDAFSADAPTSGSGSTGSYLLSEEVGMQMTNLGNCIPPKQMVGQEEDRSVALDEMFEQATALPERLEQTDLVTLDSAELARMGVIAFAPAYTLWADNAKKVRMVRVPRGESIAFDSEKQSFTIPANTRFYKTFFKRVIDLHGNESYRKMETRLIVSRPDEQQPDGSSRSTALFGTYAWNEAETEAVLVGDPLRNGKPWRDRLATYVLDEQAAEEEITKGPDNIQQALQAAGLTRTYAIPGSERCVQCHMGAPTQSFVLGFSPLQLYRRPMGEGGVIEPAERDELNQLQRLIDYGVITGMASPADVVLLEDAEGDRKPRNQHELEAQGYMVGNCAHCHNPRGFPSVVAPELRDVLDFMPSPNGGIFQFSLEKFSPRIFRGALQNVPQPYITPSLYDREPGVHLPDGTPVPGDSTTWLPKQIQYTEGDQRTVALLAPWRALIYRNVDTPFTYNEDFSIYPRMPLNTPGYDRRVRQLMGSWMVSIPARMKDFLIGSGTSAYAGDVLSSGLHPDPQPYLEVMPDDPGFDREVRLANERVRKFQDSYRYNDCPDPATVDIVDPLVASGQSQVPLGYDGRVTDEDGNIVASYTLRTPGRPHYAVTDLTEPPGAWNPRRADWRDVLVEGEIDSLPPQVQARIPTILQARVSDAVELRAFATTDVPFALWKVKDECDFSGQRKAGDFTGDERPHWMDAAAAPDDAPVYNISPGAQVFTFICQNCHGPQADSKGRLASTIADITGGTTRVANLRDGIFGPLDMPGTNRTRVFGVAADDTTTADDWAVRYMLFMGLGGTQRTIPQIALDTIRNVRVMGEERRGSERLGLTDANMLAIPLALCKATLPTENATFDPLRGDLDFSKGILPLIDKNGDAELWQHLCALGNTALPVRVVNMFGSNETQEEAHIDPQVIGPLAGGLRYPAHAGSTAYPADALIGNQHGQTELGMQPGNLAPWCIRRPSNAANQATFDAYWQEYATPGSEPPYCPVEFLADDTNAVTTDEAGLWALRGALNAGMSVFLYLDAVANGKQRPIPYDRCEDLAH